MQRGRAGGGDRIVDALDLILGRKVRRDRGGHALWHGEWPDPFGGTCVFDDVMRGEHGRGGRTTRARDQTCARVGNRSLVETRIGNRLTHRDIGISGTRPHEAQRALFNVLGDIKLYSARDLGPESMLGHLGAGNDPRLTRLE